MTTPTPLDTVGKEIEEMKAQILDTQKALAAASKTEIDFLRKHLKQLFNTRNLLQEKKNLLLEKEIIVLRGQATGKHCLSSYLLLSLGCVARTRNSPH